MTRWLAWRGVAWQGVTRMEFSVSAEQTGLPPNQKGRSQAMEGWLQAPEHVGDLLWRIDGAFLVRHMRGSPVPHLATDDGQLRCVPSGLQRDEQHWPDVRRGGRRQVVLARAHPGRAPRLGPQAARTHPHPRYVSCQGTGPAGLE
jgi:hypothetical protein